MMSAAWHLNETSAQLSCPGWQATIDLACPDVGLSLRLADSPFATNNPKAPDASFCDHPLTILGAAFGEHHRPRPSQVDAYVRGQDLVATYDEAQVQPLRVQTYWRLLSPHKFAPDLAPNVLAAFDLILSLNTSLLDSNPQSHVQSQVACTCTMFHLQSSGSDTLRATQISLTADNTNPNSTADANFTATPGNHSTGCFIARLNSVPYSYIEMVHPADFCRSTLNIRQPSPANTAGTAIQHHLFQQRLEKGVILRARVRSALVAQEYDESAAVAAYLNFAAAEPPLTV
jgi:hypothetical protein